MIPKDCKRLAEVDFPIAEVSRHAAQGSRQGHPSTLHLWWARRPLASSRAVLLALLWPDPCEPLCPEDFKKKARTLLLKVQGSIGPTNDDLRKALLKFIADFSNSDLVAHSTYLEVGRALVRAAHDEEPPLVADPFAGGGSIPIEALRLGCEAFASDLNPVACLILKVMLEDIPRHGAKLAEDLRRVGAEIKQQAEKELADLYPKDRDGATPIAYLWARTVRCESPNCGAEIPLMRSFWLGKRANRMRALKPLIVRLKGEPPHIEFEIFEPKTEKDVLASTVTRAKATCLVCGAVLPPERVRSQLASQRGGANVVFDAKGRHTGGARLLTVVTLHHGERGRYYRLPTSDDYKRILVATEGLRRLQPRGGITAVPNESISLDEIRRVSVPLYGATTWGDLFNSRQQYYLATLARAIADSRSTIAVRRLLCLALDRLVTLMSAHCRWKPSGESLIDMFGRHAIGMVWDYAETAPNQVSGDLWNNWIKQLAEFVEYNGRFFTKPGQVMLGDAAHQHLPDASAAVWFTDPPYYDSIPYAHLADCFYVWLKRAMINDEGQSDFSLPLIAKEQECVVDRPHKLSKSLKNRDFFEAKMASCARDGRRVLTDAGIGCVVFAHKTTEGWESLISGFVRSGWSITASWPIATELATRLNARDNASLGTSVHLVCRPRPVDASVGDWAGVLRELPTRVGDWMERLQSEGVRGADLVFACIGPALEIFSRYAKVETAEGREVALAEYLEKVWEVVGRSALAQVLGTAEAKARNGAAGAVEEDSRLTALFLWTLQSTDGETADDVGDKGDDEEPSDEDDDDEGSTRSKAKGFTLVFDVVRRFAQPLGIDLPKWEGRVIETKKGVVRLLPIAERAKQLFGDDGAQAVAARLEQEVAVGTNPLQGMLFPDLAVDPKVRRRGRGHGTLGGIEVSDESLAAAREATTLDRVHAAMLLQAGGRTNALRALLKSEQERGSDFLRLANAFSALYPKGSEEKRLVDAMLLAAPR